MSPTSGRPNYERLYYESERLWTAKAPSTDALVRRYLETTHLIPTEVRSLLDVGCGNGEFGKVFLHARPNAHVVACDRSETAVGYVQRESVIADGVALPFRLRSFDCVTCLEVIEHLPEPAFRPVLAELCRLANRYVVVSVPYKERVEQNTARCVSCRTVFNVDLHLRSFDDETIESLLSAQGFRLVATRFPGSRVRLRYLTAVWNYGSRLRARHRAQWVPMCPVCGFEPERSLPEATGGSPPVASQPPNRALLAVARKMRIFWPTEQDRGYWIVALYERG